MLVLTRTKTERILIQPDKRAERLVELLTAASDKLADPDFDGDLRELVGKALPLAEGLAGEAVIVTLIKVTPNRARIGIDACAERAIVREEIAGELKVPA